MASIHRWVALFLLAWMPLQAVAVPLLTWHCASHDAGLGAADEAVDRPCPSHDVAAAADPQANDGQRDQDAGSAKPGDFCCSHFSAVPAALVVAAIGRVPFEAPVATPADFSFLSRPPVQPPRV
jgi:hypothetical protein